MAKMKNYLPALKGRVGQWAFYVSLMSFEEVANYVKLSDEIYSSKKLSDMIQRYVDRSRAEKISKYLFTELERFFPAMVVAVYEGTPNWLEFELTNNNKSNIDVASLNVSKIDSFGFLALSGDEKLFPLDGQHRLAGIRHALKSTEQVEKLGLKDDEIAVILVAHEPNEKGRKRSRRLFTLLNKRAVSVKKHEIIALDEDDAMAISTRYLVEEFKKFSNTKLISFRESPSIPASDKNSFTTIVMVYDILTILFDSISIRKKQELRYNRPDDEWQSVYNFCASVFFESMLKIYKDVGKCFSSKDPQNDIENNRHADGGNIMFRPIGQLIISELISFYLKKENLQIVENNSISPDHAKNVLGDEILTAFKFFKNIPTQLNEKPYNGLIWNDQNGRIMVSGRSVVRDIILYSYKLTNEAEKIRLEKRLKEILGYDGGLSEYEFNPK